MTSTTRQTTAALLTTATLLNRTELAEKAGVTTRSLRDHLPTLEAIGLIDITDQGIRFVLPFPTKDERGADIIPGIVAGSVFEQPVDVTVDLIIALIDEEALDPDHPIGASCFSFDMMGALRDCDHLVPSLRWVEWFDLLDRLVGTDPPERSESGFEQMELKIGPPIEQTAVQEVAG